jgi:hypothetical protein
MLDTGNSTRQNSTAWTMKELCSQALQLQLTACQRWLRMCQAVYKLLHLAAFSGISEACNATANAAELSCVGMYTW